MTTVYISNPSLSMTLVDISSYKWAAGLSGWTSTTGSPRSQHWSTRGSRGRLHKRGNPVFWHNTAAPPVVSGNIVDEF